MEHLVSGWPLYPLGEPEFYEHQRELIRYRPPLADVPALFVFADYLNLDQAASPSQFICCMICFPINSV